MTAQSPHKKAVIVFVFIILAGCLSTIGCQQSSEPAPFFGGFYLTYGEVLAKSPKPEDVIWTREIRYAFEKLEDGSFYVKQEVRTRRGEGLKQGLEPIPYPQVGDDLTIDKFGIVLKGGDGMNFIDGYLSYLWLPPDKRKKGADLFKVKIMWRVEGKMSWEGWEVWPVRMLTQDDIRYYDVNTGFLVGEEHMGGKWKMTLQDTNLEVLKDAIAPKIEGDSTSALLPKEVVQQFCQLDAEGYRLSSDGVWRTEPLVAWSGEPGWDNVIVISDYRVIKVEAVGKKAMVTVKYFILGSTDSIEFVKLNREEEIIFELGMINGNRKITKPQLPPHVSKATIVRHLRKIQSRAPIKARRDQLETEIQAIIEADK
jgi:hypothetical protein